MHRDRDFLAVGGDGYVPVAAGGDRGHVVIDRREVLRPVAREAHAEHVLALAGAPVIPVAGEKPRPQPRPRGVASRAPRPFLRGPPLDVAPPDPPPAPR